MEFGVGGGNLVLEDIYRENPLYVKWGFWLRGNKKFPDVQKSVIRKMGFLVAWK